MENGLVSIVVPMKNASGFVRATVDSVLAQTYSNWEMYIVDDCSTDKGKSIAIIKEYAEQDNRIHLITLSKGRGSSGARNEGLKYIKGQYLALLDSDDIWHPDYLQTMLNHIKENTVQNGAIYFCGYKRLNDDCSEEIRPEYSCPGVKTYKRLLHNCPIFPSITIIDLAKLHEPVHFKEELKNLRDDYVFLLDILKQGFVAVGYSDILVDYRMRRNSLTASKKKMIKPQWKVYRNVLHLNWFKSCYYLLCWGLNGIRKYFL